LRIFIQANNFMLNSLRKKCKIENEKFYINIANCGNTISSSIPIALYNAKSKNQFQKNDNTVLAVLRFGYSWASTLIKII
jgi:3-oxoacyl-[acyl-carrier-protein] synthase-3